MVAPQSTKRDQTALRQQAVVIWTKALRLGAHSKRHNTHSAVAAMIMKFSKLSTVVFNLAVGVVSVARANKARPSSSLDEQQHYLTTRRSLRQGDDIFSHNDRGKGRGGKGRGGKGKGGKGGTKKSKGSKGSKGSMGSTSSASNCSSGNDPSSPTPAPTTWPTTSASASAPTPTTPMTSQPPTLAPTTPMPSQSQIPAVSCPCFNSTDIDKQVEALEDSECSTNASNIIFLDGFRPNATDAIWIAFAGSFESELPPACLFLDPANGFGSESDEPTFNITSDELEACQSILLESQTFAVNENCTVVEF